MNVVFEIWAQFRPYFVARTVDFLSIGTLWFGLFAFKWLTLTFKVGGWVESFAVVVHEVGTLVAFVFLAYYGVRDLIRLRQGSDRGSNVAP